VYALLHIIKLIKSRKIRWAGHVTRMGKIKVYTKFWSENLKVRHHSDELGISKCEGEVVPALFLTEGHAMKAYWGNGCIAPRIL
jgi:hypothetical protein